MLSLLSTAAVAAAACLKDHHCAEGETCKITLPPRIGRACVEREEFAVNGYCTDDLAHCCPLGTTCERVSWWAKKCKAVQGQCEKKKPDICCQALPTCKEGFAPAAEGECTDADFASGQCVKEGLCCKEITCVKKQSCTLSCGTVVPHGWSGKGEGDNHCNSCGCNDGSVICTEQFCTEKKECPCNEFTKESFCIAQEGVCYNAGQCKCGFFEKAQCLVEPCSVNSCPKGYTCRNNYCGGCHHQCVKEEETPKPKPDICCQAFPTCKDGFERDAKGVCTKEDFASGRCVKEALCCKEITCVKKEEEKKKSCTLSCGTVVPHGWGGKGEGADHCNSCGCIDGNVICTEQFCVDQKCPCNEFTKESFCIAQEGVCYNAGQCKCGFFEKAQCLVEPCSVNSCPKGYTCRNNYCGGCHHQCVKEE